jgi:endonuclease G, mitochondrial
MTELSNQERRQLREAILSAYPSPGDLDIFVSEELDKNLAAIAGGSNLKETAFNLVKWATAKGYIDNLILALAKDTSNPYVQSFCSRALPTYLRLNSANSALTSLPLATLQTDWGIETSEEALQAFFPRQFSFEADVGELQRGLSLADSVCKVTFSDRSPQACGTGVLIAPDLLLTNYHVFSLAAEADLTAIAKSAKFQFGDVSKLGKADRQPPRTAAENAIACFSPIEQLDYVLLHLKPNADAEAKPVPFDATAMLSPGEPLNLLQHPEGEQMKVSLSNNGIVKTKAERGLLLYVNRTMGGSSGSPCFNEEWKLVALHHKELVTSFGSVREGILLSAIYPQIAPFL